MADSPQKPSSSSAPSKSSVENLDQTYYTWSTFFNILLGTAGDREIDGYLNARDTLNEESDCKRCERWRDWAFQSSPIVGFLRQQIRDTADGPEITAENVRCQRCPQHWRQHGGFSPKYGILLCANVLRSRSKLEDSLAHELVHAYDHVRFKVDQHNLRHAACTEIRASMLSGECRFTREWGPGQKISRGWEDCIKRRAALSVRMRKACKDDAHAAQLVNEVWHSCSSDTRPFDEVYR